MGGDGCGGGEEGGEDVIRDVILVGAVGHHWNAVLAVQRNLPMRC